MRSSQSLPAEPLAIGRQARLARLIARPFAHRGLHRDGVVENSIAAFEAAIGAGQGFELDVQETADGQALVFHDYALERLTGQKGSVRERVMADLSSFTLAGTDQPLVSLPQLIQQLGTERSILVEIKSRNRSVWRLCGAVLDAIQGREAQIAVMSFNPEVGRWFAHHAPEVLRGLVVTEEDDGNGLWGRIKGGSARVIALARARPDFLAYDIRSLPSPLPERLRVAGMPVLTWTVRTREDLAKAKACTDQIIHELPPDLWPHG